MQIRLAVAAALVLGGMIPGWGAEAADPVKPAPVTPAPVIGQDAMGDKSRSGPDGWSWAPVSRNQAASGKAPGQTEGKIAAAPNARPDSHDTKPLSSGEDPGTPASAASAGPGTLDAASPNRKP